MAQTNSRIKKIFNLLTPKPPPPTVWDNIYNWLVTNARVVMIVAEIFVVVVFVGKVVVDTEAKNLDETIKKLDQQIKFSYSGIEPRIQSIQQKSKSYMAIWEGSSTYTDIMKELNGYLKDYLANISIGLEDDVVTINGFADRSQLVIFEDIIKSSPTFINVEVIEVKSDTNNTGKLGFGIRAKIKQFGKTKRPY